MEWVIVRRELTYSYIEVRAAFLGADVMMCVQGGDRPHIGCTVQTVPRPSLTGVGSVSVTSSVMNLTGHKDETLCRKLAEQVCRAFNCTVVCTGGFHVDDMSPQQIEEVIQAADEIGEKVKKGLGEGNS